MNPLHVVTAVANPVRWESRIRLARQFIDHMRESGVHVTLVECQTGERPFDFHSRDGLTVVHVRSKTLVWNKENLMNIGFSRLPDDWKYAGWFDADIRFRKLDWALEAVHQLQQYDVIQPWSDCYDLGPHDEHIVAHKSFLRQYWLGENENKGPYGYYGHPGGHPGYAWACTREAFNGFGGLFEVGALGAGDHHMALAFIGRVNSNIPPRINRSYLKHLKAWEARALKAVEYNLGFQWGTIEHHYHGRKVDRKYWDRWQILIENEFDPDTDLKRNSYGVLELACNKPRLRHAIDRYFHARNEDINSL